MSYCESPTSFSITANPLNSNNELGEGLWLLLVGISETPPHIALIYEGKYYSVSARKVDYGTPLEKLMNTIKRKKVPTLFIHFITKDTEFTIEKIYKDLQPLGNTEDTCLSPIKRLFTKYYSHEFAGVNYVFELLALAEKKGLIKECLSVNNELPGTSPNLITIPKYNMVQIRNRIKKSK